MPVNEIFSGIEAEGRLKGTPTVFSQHPCIEAVEFAKAQGFTHVFFGARGHVLTPEDMTELERLLLSVIPPTWIITLHVRVADCWRISAMFYERCHILLYMPFPLPRSLGTYDVEVKLEDHNFAAVFGNPQIVDLAYVHDRNKP